MIQIKTYTINFPLFRFMKASVTWELAIYLNLSQEVIFNIKSKQSEKVNCFGFFAVALPQLVCSLMLTKTLFFLNDDQY